MGITYCAMEGCERGKFCEFKLLNCELKWKAPIKINLMRENLFREFLFSCDGDE